jgi:hypothetical protein
MFVRIKLSRLVIAVCAAAGFLALACVQAEAEQQGQAVIYQAKPDSPLGKRNPDGAAELAHVEFLIGNWDVDVTSEKTDQRGGAINREIYFDITRSSFKVRSEVSRDGGETWERGTFELTASRKNP